MIAVMIMINTMFLIGLVLLAPSMSRFAREALGLLAIVSAVGFMILVMVKGHS